MRSLLEQILPVDAIAEVDCRPAASGEPGAYQDYVPNARGAPRPARRIAMQARREQDRHLGGW